MLQTIPRLFAAGGFFLPVGQGASAGWRFVVWSNPLIELVLDVPSGLIRVGAPPRCERGQHIFAPGAGAPTERWCPWRTSTGTSALRGVAHELCAICNRNVANSNVYNQRPGGALGGRAPARPQYGV